MKGKRKKELQWGMVCLVACLLLCGCAKGEVSAAEKEAAAASGSENTTTQEIATQLSELQSKLDAIEAQYRELQAKAEQSASEQELADTHSGAVSQPKPPSTQQTALYTYQKEGEGVVLTKYLGEAREVTVPGAIDGMRVVGLADSAFAGTSVKSVVLPDTIKTLGWFTFYGCSSLERVSIPASVGSIGYASFDGCSSALTLSVAKDSYAQKYAASFALRYVTP